MTSTLRTLTILVSLFPLLLLAACSTSTDSTNKDVHSDASSNDMLDGFLPDTPSKDHLELLDTLSLDTGLTDAQVVDGNNEDIPSETSLEETYDLNTDSDALDTTPDVSEVPVPHLSTPTDEYGGFTDLHLAEGTGFFTTVVADNRAWVVTPEGNAFLSMGIQAIGFGSLTSDALGYAPGSYAQLAALAPEFNNEGEISGVTTRRMMEATLSTGFNTLGAWNGGAPSICQDWYPFTNTLQFANYAPRSENYPVPLVSEGGFPDVFHPNFEPACQEYAAASIPSYSIDNPWCIGTFTDNELRWHGQDFLAPADNWTLTDDFIDEAAESPGKMAFVTFMEERYAGDITAFNSTYDLALESFDDLLPLTSLPFFSDNPTHLEDRVAFLQRIADTYFQTTNAAVKAITPNQLNLCARIASVAAKPVWEAAGRSCDVISINDYYIPSQPLTDMVLGGPAEQRWLNWSTWAFSSNGPKPFWLTEFGLRAEDSGLPNTFGAGFVGKTQQDRLNYYRDQIGWLLDRATDATAYATGWHWFMYLDEPATGRYDGEDGNYGLYTIRNEPYHFLRTGMQALHQAVAQQVVTGAWPTLLAPPEALQATVSQEHILSATWAPREHAAGYRVWLMDHPAGVETNLIESHETSETSIELNVSHLGSGLIWVAVEATNDQFLTLGAATSSPVALPPVSSLNNEQVLDCESAAGTRFHNELTFPNDLWGQTYVRLIDSFLEGEGNALELRFLPSSLGFITGNDPNPPRLDIALVLPEPVNVNQGEQLVFEIRSHHFRALTWLGSASRLVAVTLENSSQEPMQTTSLDEFAVNPLQSTTVTIPVEAPFVLARIHFTVDVQQPALAMDQSIVIEVDRFQIVEQ